MAFFGYRRSRLLVGPLLLVICGCQQPVEDVVAAPRPGEPSSSAARVANMRGTVDVVTVAAFYDATRPWLWNEDRTQVRGIVISALYLGGPHAKGVFGDGVIRPKMYVKEKSADGKITWKLVKEWEFDEQKAMLFRAKKQTHMGWGYRLHLRWEDINLGGREIRMVVTYERSDGNVVRSAGREFLVPLRS